MVSTTRIKWLDELRFDVSELVTEASNTVYYNSTKEYAKKQGEEELDKNYALYNKSFKKYSNLLVRIRLLLDFDKPKHRRLQNSLVDISKLLNHDTIDNVTPEMMMLQLTIVQGAANNLIRAEWNMVNDLLGMRFLWENIKNFFRKQDNSDQV